MGAIVNGLTAISQYLPEIKQPVKEVPFKEKLMWTTFALVLFYIMGNIFLIGIDTTQGFGVNLGFAQTILASQIGTIITLGIGPIVMASIFLQLFTGAKLIDLDMGSQEGRAKFQALQKILAVLLCFFQAFIYVNPTLIVPIGGVALTNPIFWFLILQIAFGSLALLYLDEIVAKYGMGSGVSLFIAGGVSAGIFWQILRFPVGSLIPQGGVLWSTLITGDLLLLIPVVAIIAIFLVIVFAEGMHVNIPITMGHRGTGGRYPVKFLYVSNMPVILAMALFLNITIFANFVRNIPILGPLFNVAAWATMFPSIGNTQLFNATTTGSGSLVQGLLIQGITPLTTNALIQGLVFLFLLIIFCVIFGWFWVQMGNQSTSAVAGQLERSGMQIPGFRKDRRVIEKVLNRYIPPITIIGSIFVALLAGLGDFVLSGIASGTGILLTVGIIYRLYEEIAKSQADLLTSLLGKKL
jgi:preprotein translocase subunit SecY